MRNFHCKCTKWMKKLLWYMCNWSTVYKLYTLKLVVLVVCIPGMPQVLFVYEGMVAKFPSLRQIGYNSAEFKKIFGRFLVWKVTLYVLTCITFQTDIFYHLKFLRYGDIAICLSPLSSFVSRFIFSRPFREMKKV